jgi:hypothetical protein
MAKNKTFKSSNTSSNTSSSGGSKVKQKGKASRIVFIIFVSILAFMFLRIVVIDPLLAAREKTMFEQAEADLKLIAEEVQEVIGKADDSAQDNTCGRPNLKYSQGPLSCSTSRKMVYIDLGLEQTNKFIDELASHLSSSQLTSEYSDNGQRFDKPEEIRSLYVSVNQEFSLDNSLRCGITYITNLETDNYRAFPDKKIEKKDLIISLHCSGSARAEHYTMRD